MAGSGMLKLLKEMSNLRSIGSIIKMREPFLDRTICAKGNKGKFGNGKMEIAYSDDRGETWTVVPVGSIPGEYILGFNSLTEAFGKLFLATSASKIYISEDAAASWMVCEDVFTSTPYQWIAQIGERLFAASEDVLIKSSDKGKTWNYVNLPPDNSSLNFAGAE